MLVPIEKIIVKDRIRKDFGDISELAKDIEKNGLINPLTVISISDGTYILLAGERRLKALKEIGWKHAEVFPVNAETAERRLNIEISENETRKDFSKSERHEMYRRMYALESAKAKERMVTSTGGDNPQPVHNSSQADIGKAREKAATHFGVSHDTLRREGIIIENKQLLDPEDFEDWDEGKLSTNKAFLKVKAELDRQKAENERLRNRPPETKTVVKEVQVVPDDYESTKREAKMINSEYQKITQKLATSREKISELEKQNSDLYAELEKGKSEYKDQEEHIRKTALAFNAGIANFIERYGGYVWLTERVDEIPDRERNGFIKGLNALEAWVSQMQENIANSEGGMKYL